MGYESDYRGLCEHRVGGFLPGIMILKRGPRGSETLAMIWKIYKV